MVQLFTCTKLSTASKFACGICKLHATPIVRIYLILFYIKRGLHSGTEIGEREINGSTVHSIGAVGNRTLFSCLPPSPPPLHNLIRGAIWSPTSLSPPLSPCPPSHPYPFWTV
jgi:hypothetical protein